MAGPSARLMLVVLLTLAGGAGCRRASGDPLPAVVLSPCRLEGVPTPLQCGAVEVFEDRARGAGRRLELRVAVAPALAARPEPDPLFVLAGGPGQAASETARLLLPALERIRRTRDVVFVDQRGTGGSHPLPCFEPAPDAGVAELLRVDIPREEMRRCLAGYDADVRLYTTPVAMDDLDEVRAALGYARINLYGISYGTRAALEYLRRHGARVRTATLDGVAPMSLYLPLSLARDAERALDLLFAHCAQDPRCAAAYPRLEERFAALLAQLERAPARVQAPHPVTGAPLEVEVGREVFAANLRGLLYVAESSALVPLLIDRAAAGDWRPFLAASAQLSGGFSRGIAWGMFLSVVCSEDAPFLRPEDVAREAGGTWLGAGVGQRMLEACQAWPRGVLPPDYRAPVRSEVPVLLLSGELDPVTPPTWGEEARRTLPNSLHVVVPAVGHNTLGRACARDVMRRFLEAGSVAGLAPACGEAPTRPPFFLNFAGPTP